MGLALQVGSAGVVGAAMFLVFITLFARDRWIAGLFALVIGALAYNRTFEAGAVAAIAWAIVFGVNEFDQRRKKAAKT